MSYNACLVKFKNHRNSVLDCSGLPIRAGDFVSPADDGIGNVYIVDEVGTLPLSRDSSVDCVWYSYESPSGHSVRICAAGSKLRLVGRYV